MELTDTEKRLQNIHYLSYLIDKANRLDLDGVKVYALKIADNLEEPWSTIIKDKFNSDTSLAVQDKNDFMKKIGNIEIVPLSNENDWNFNNDICKICGKNPKNGGDGICHCTIGIPKITF